MLESVRCPNCAAHYGLKADRVSSGIRRARCFRCRSVFGIEAEVQRLLALSAAAPLEPMPLESAPAEVPSAHADSVMNSDIADIGLDELIISPDDLASLSQEESQEETPAPEAEAAEAGALGAATQELPEESEGYPEQLPPSLTLGDLEGGEDEILEKTIITESEDFPPLPEPAQEATTPEGAFASSPDFQGAPTATGGFASARDAISKLLGDIPKSEAQPERRPPTKTNSHMDVEAALDALDSTLGGSQAQPITSTRPIVQPPQFHSSESAPMMTSTVKLSHEELMEAMRTASTPASGVAPATQSMGQVPPRPTPPDPFAAQSTAFTATSPAQAPQSTMPSAPAAQLPPAPVFAQPPASALDSDETLYRVQLPKEVVNNLNLETLAMWVEQGRVQEFHMVARQQSEHWIEAGKVPGLRMAFERIRRPNQVRTSSQIPEALNPPPAKKGLFGGIFGRS